MKNQLVLEVNVNNLTAEEVKSWNELLECSNNGTIYHSIEWICLQSQYLNIEARCLLAFTDSKPVGLFPFFVRKKRGVIRHLTVGPIETPYGGPIVRKELSKEEITSVYNKLLHYFGSLRASSYSIDSVIDFPEEVFTNNGYSLSSKISSVLNLSDGKEQLMKKMRRNHKRQLKKAHRNKLEIVFDKDFVHLSDYYDLLKETYSRLQSKNIVDFSFYQHSVKTLKSIDRIHLIMVKQGDVFVAGGLILCYLDTVIFWRGAAREDAMQIGASNLLYWSIICWALDRDCNYLDTLHNPNKSLEHFKRGFGCKEYTSWRAYKESRIWSNIKTIKNFIKPTQK